MIDVHVYSEEPNCRAAILEATISRIITQALDRKTVVQNHIIGANDDVVLFSAVPFTIDSLITSPESLFRAMRYNMPSSKRTLATTLTIAIEPSTPIK